MASRPPEITIWAQGNPFRAYYHQYLPLFFKKKKKKEKKRKENACGEKVMERKSQFIPLPGQALVNGHEAGGSSPEPESKWRRKTLGFIMKPDRKPPHMSNKGSTLLTKGQTRCQCLI